MAVRNILACRIAQKDNQFSEKFVSSKEKYELILKFVNNAMNKVYFILFIFIYNFFLFFRILKINII